MSLFGTSWEDPKTAAIMGLAGGLLQGNAGAGLQQGLLGYQRQSAINTQNTRQQKMDAREDEEFALKKTEAQRKIDSDKLTRETLKQAAMELQAGTFNPAKYAGVLPAETLKSFVEMPQWGEPEVARTIKGRGPNGREYEYQVDKRGKKIGEGFEQYRAPLMQDLGGQVAALDPYTLMPQAQFGKSMTPDGRAADARGWASNRIAQERLNLDKNQGQYQFNADLGGYVPKAPGGQFVPLAGVPNAGAPKLTEGEAKAGLYLGQMRSASDTLGQLDKRGVTARPESVALAGSTIGNYLAPKEAQQIAQVRNQWSEAYLRAKTGAAATQGEVDLNNRTFFPQPGDSQAVIEQKAQARIQAEMDMQMPAGRAAQRTQIAPQPQPKQGQLGSGSFRILSVE